MTSKDKNMRCIYIYTYMNMSIKQKRLLAVLLKLTMFPWQEEVPFTRFGFVAHPTRCQRGFPQGKLQKRRSGRFRQRRLQPSHLGCWWMLMDVAERGWNGSWGRNHCFNIFNPWAFFRMVFGGCFRISEANPAGRFHFKSFLACTVFVWDKCFWWLSTKIMSRKTSHRFLLTYVLWHIISCPGEWCRDWQRIGLGSYRADGSMQGTGHRKEGQSAFFGPVGLPTAKG